MRLKVFLALAAIPLHAAETDDNKRAVPIEHLAAPVAEPIDGGFYAPPTSYVDEGPSPADIGPVQKKFALASQRDNLDMDPRAPNANNLPKDNIALDKHIRIPLVHDVQDNDSYRGGSNDSLLYEVKYLNWGAETAEQLRARQGHYFTITVANHGPKADLLMRFQYRQVKSKQVVRTLYQDEKNVSGATRAYFGVVNHAYLAYGPVSAWRFTVLRDGVVVAEAKSYLW
jgi:hypothetical protein